VRPGAYYIQLAYVGIGSYTTQWVRSTGQATYVRQESTRVTAKLGNTPVTAPTVTVTEGASLTGKVVGSNGKAVRDVFVSARTAWSSTREVVAQVTSGGSDGAFILRGLPPNKTVFVRVNGSLIGRGAASSGSITTPGPGASKSVGSMTVPD